LGTGHQSRLTSPQNLFTVYLTAAYFSKNGWIQVQSTSVGSGGTLRLPLTRGGFPRQFRP
jgi:hypothetical protein